MNIVERMISLIAPHECIVCSLQGDLLCDTCRIHDLVAPSSICVFCKRLTYMGKTCDTCIRKHPLDSVWVASLYEGSGKELIHQTKYDEKRAGVDCIARVLYEQVPVGFSADCIVAVPTITSHARKRGYDHTSQIARRLAVCMRTPSLSALVRLDQEAQQGGNRTVRTKQIKNTMRLSSGVSVNGLTVLIIDDVITTGATLTEVAKVLKRHGAKKIYATVFARA